jgi:hypothetical protein
MVTLSPIFRIRSLTFFLSAFILLEGFVDKPTYAMVDLLEPIQIFNHFQISHLLTDKLLLLPWENHHLLCLLL